MGHVSNTEAVTLRLEWLLGPPWPAAVCACVSDNSDSGGLAMDRALGSEGPIADEPLPDVNNAAIARWKRYAKLLMICKWCRGGMSAYGNYLQIFTHRARRIAIRNAEVDEPPAVHARAKPKSRPARPRRQ